MNFNKFLILGFSVCLVFLLSFGLVTSAKAAGGSLLIFPQTGTFTVGNTFDVSIFLNTGGNNVNVIDLYLKFDPTKLQVVTPAKGISKVGEWVFPPSFSNKKGEITLQGGFPGGINTSEGLITVIVFQAISSGEVTLEFLESSEVLLGDSQGTNILSSFNRGTYDIIPSPPLGPKIFSETHPDQNKWYKSSEPTFFWEKVKEAEGYSYESNDDPFGEPDDVIDIKSNSVFFENIKEGIRYFHLKAKKAGVWGGTSHFKVMVDKTPPLEFKPRLGSPGFGSGDYLLIYFDARDLLSGIDHYQARIADYTDIENIIWTAWNREESPFKFRIEKKGFFTVLIRAFDQAGNFREETIQLRTFNPILSVLVNRGIQVKGTLLPLWILYLSLTIILSGTGYLTIKRIRKKPKLVRIDLEKEIKEAEKEIEDVRKVEEELERSRRLEEERGKKWQGLKGALDKIKNKHKTDTK